MSEIGKLPENELVEDAGGLVTVVGVSGRLNEGINNFQEGNTSGGVYNTIRGISTGGIFVAVALGLLAPEAIVFWGIEMIIADQIEKAAK